MAIRMNRPAPTSYYQPTPTNAPCPDVCPACGGLECLCRPRFFAGQLLTDEDFNRLDHYITAKQRLHNRYLHGWGVVCGLEVLCHPCQGYVNVTAGYALSPCGEDIIACKDDVVNICELIQRCRERDRAYECEPLRPHTADGCRDLEEEWILAICYGERATRGVTALRSGAGSGGCTGCNCGGSSGCACGCHQKTNGYANGNRTRKAAKPPQCEPTVTCETYSFILRRPPARQTTDQPQVERGDLVERALCCLQEIFQVLIRAPIQDDSWQPWHRWCCALQTAFQDLFARRSVHDCQLDERLAAFHCPDPAGFESDPDYIKAVKQAVKSRLIPIAVEYARACLCSALLPPCPPPAADNCVPLASIWVRRSDCQVLKVCNLGFRQTVISTPALQYWLSLLPMDGLIGDLVDAICCQPARIEDDHVDFHPAAIASAAAPTASTFATRAQLLAGLANQAWDKPAGTVTPYTLLLDALGAVDFEGKPLLSALERNNPVEAVLFDQILAPLLRNFLPSIGAVSAEASAATVDVATELAQMHAIIEQQRQTVEALQQEVNKLKKRRGSA
jgi:hypothetical protein